MQEGKTLFLLRHAKSNWDDCTVSDRERPLSSRGERDAQKMSKRWAKHATRPDLIISSPAARALSTARLVAKKIGYRAEDIVVDDRLYGGSEAELLAVVEQLDDKVERVMLVGHNPEFSDLAQLFCGTRLHMPTCARAEFRFDSKRWASVGHSTPRRTSIETPKHAT